MSKRVMVGQNDQVRKILLMEECRSTAAGHTHGPIRPHKTVSACLKKETICKRTNLKTISKQGEKHRLAKQYLPPYSRQFFLGFYRLDCNANVKQGGKAYARPLWSRGCPPLT